MSGRHLKKLRIANGYSQAQVAKELHIDRTKVSRWENDIVLPNENEIQSLARLFSVDAGTIKANLSFSDDTDQLKESIIAEKIDELHLSVSSELNAAIANQEESIRQHGEQIEIQKESLKRINEQLKGEQKLKEEYKYELKQNQDKYDRRLRNVLLCFVAVIIILTIIVFLYMFFFNWANSQEKYTVIIPAEEIKEDSTE